MTIALIEPLTAVILHRSFHPRQAKGSIMGNYRCFAAHITFDPARPRRDCVSFGRVRLWSLHPKHLDAKGLVALWREGLLARHVLLGETVGYRHHPQLLRFRALRSPINGIDSYLSRVLDEAQARGYAFDQSKIVYRRNSRIIVTRGQLEYEWQHLLAKLEVREPPAYRKWRKTKPEAHPCFFVVPGPVQAWERKK